MPNFCDLVILFTRYPQPGKCKTRLIPALGEDDAAEIHRALTGHTLAAIDAQALAERGALQIYYDGGRPQEMDDWLGKDFYYIKQQGSTLGERMEHAFTDNAAGGQPVILIGSDCPDLNASLLSDALIALNDHDMVIGPAHDGGYYLIGMTPQTNKTVCSRIFNNIPWSTNKVFNTTIERADEQQLSVHILPTLHDIDTPEDLRYFHHHSHAE